MKILLINHEFTVTGASLMLFKLAQHLKSLGHEVLVHPMVPGHGPIYDMYQKSEIPLLASFDPRQFDLAIGNTIVAAPLICQIGSAVRTIWWIHEAEIGIRLLINNHAWVNAFVQATHIVYPSGYQVDVFKSFTYYLPIEKFSVIANGVDVNYDKTVVCMPKRKSLRIVQVGSIEPRKRPEDLIMAVNALPPDIDVECLLVGKYHHLSDEARAIVDANPDKFSLVGEVSNDAALAYMESADIITLCSASEVQALVLYEAAMLGKPLIISNIRVFAAHWRNNFNCLTYGIGNFQELTKAIHVLATNPQARATIAEKGKATASIFTMDRFFGQFDDLVLKVCSTVKK